MSKDSVVTRFAPSPTGALHIGGLRTALYSYLMAKANGGKFILRIEDTDQARLRDDSVSDIIESLKWAGLNWDEGPIYQSSRLGEYANYSQRLLDTGHAYRCFCSPERLEKLREDQKSKKMDIGYDRKCRNLSQEEIDSKLSKSESFTIRLKLPSQGLIHVNDLIRGNIEYNYENLEDLVIVKADGFPTYHLAHVVDDSLMNVTHVFRGTEWIPTSPMHAFMFDVLNLDRIQYVHLPLILSPDGGKLSKRSGATSVKEFREAGYTKEGLINFLSLLGWSLDDKTENFTLKELEEHFDPLRISKSASVLSYDKLNYFNNMYIKQYDMDSLFDLAIPHLIELIGSERFENDKENLKKIVALYKDRLVTVGEIKDYVAFFYSDEMLPQKVSDFEIKKMAPDIVLSGLKVAREVIDNLSTWQLDDLNTDIKIKIKNSGLKMPQVFMPLRLAVTGTAQTPSITDIVILLGRKLVVKRLERAFEVLSDENL